MESYLDACVSNTTPQVNMDPGIDLQELTSNISQWVQVALSPNSAQPDRFNAYQQLENFRANAHPVQLSRIGLLMTSSPSPEVVVAGFQYVEQVVAYNWDNFPDRDPVKACLCTMVQEANPVFAINYVQESMARVLAEIAKKEWPQLWRNMIPELCRMADTSDIPLLILRRLVEDIGTLQKVDSSERKNELSRSLTAVSRDLVSTFFTLLANLSNKINETNQTDIFRRMKLILNSLLPYVEWVVDPLIFIHDNRTSKMFECLKWDVLKMEAIACILQLVERKPRDVEEKHAVSFNCLTTATTNILSESVLKCAFGDVDYLRKVGSVLTSLTNVVPPDGDSMSNLIDVIISLLERPEAEALVSGAFAYNALLRNVDIDERKCSEEDLKIVRIMDLLVGKLFQPPDSSDKEELNNLRSQFSQILRSSSKLIKKLYARVSVALRHNLSSEDPVDKHIWEAVTFIVDATASNVSKDEEEIILMGLQDLNDTFVKFDKEIDLELKSTILSTVSSLFVFLSLTMQRQQFSEIHLSLLQQIVEGLLNCLTVEDAGNGKGLRHHVISLFIKLAAKFPDLIVLTFDLINNFLTGMGRCINLLERQSLIETLLIASNSWKSVEKQSALICSVVAVLDWTTFSRIVENSQSLIQMFREADFIRTKAMITCNLSILYAVLRRIKVAEGENGEPTPRHPGYRFIYIYLPTVFKCIQSLHQLLGYSEMQYVFEMSDSEKSQVLGVANYVGSSTTARNQPVTSRLAVLESISSPYSAESTHPKKIKVFVQAISELCYGILGETCTLLSPSIYEDTPDLANAFIECVGSTINTMNDYRVRTILRNVYRPFLLAIPISFAETMLKPFAEKFFPYMTNRLCERWRMVEEANKSPDEGEEEKEVIESSVLRLLTKEYFELIQRIMERSASNDLLLSNEDPMDMDGAEQGGEDFDLPSRPKPKNPHQGCANELGDVGSVLLNDPACFHAIVHLSIVGLCWDDSLVSFRAGRCLLLAWNEISKNADAVHAVFNNSLRCLCTWIDNESNLDVLVRIVDLIFKTFHQSDQAIVRSLLDWGAPQSQVDLLTSLCGGARLKNEKKRKDLIRKLGRSNPNVQKNTARKSSWLTGLPKLVIQKDLVKPTAAGGFDLSGFNSLIHL